VHQNHCNQAIAKQLHEHPNLASLEDKSLQDGHSTGVGSSLGTPRASVAPVGGTKLRLTLGGGSNGVTTNGTTSGAASGTE